MSCPHVPGELTARIIDRLMFQYKESPNLKAFLSVFAVELELIESTLCDMYDFAGEGSIDQIGNAAGFPRCHCSGARKKVFGFRIPGDICCDPGYVGDFCEVEAPWGCIQNGGTEAYETYCFEDDALYAQYVGAKLIKNRSTGTIPDIVASIQALYGTNAHVIYSTDTKVVVATGRALTAEERRISRIAYGLIPVPRGVTLEIQEVENAFGAGPGWSGWCDGSFGKAI